MKDICQIPNSPRKTGQGPTAEMLGYLTLCSNIYTHSFSTSGKVIFSNVELVDVSNASNTSLTKKSLDSNLSFWE